MDIVIGVVVGLLVLMSLVTLHEFGHFIMARLNGVRVLEFGICFPPRAMAWVKDPKTKKWRKLPKKEWGKPQEGLIFSLNWLPIGGFCQMDGESAADRRKGTFGAASFWAKTKILFGGVAMNWLVAIVIFTVLAWTGMPEFLERQFTIEADTRTEATPVQVTSVAEDSPAKRAGIQTDDYIVAVGGQEVWRASEINEFNREHAGEIVEYRIMHDYTVDESCCPEGAQCQISCEDMAELEATRTVEVELNSAEAEYLLGVTMASTQALSYSTWSAPIVGVGLTAQLTGETFRGVGVMIGNLASGIARQFSVDTSVRESGRAALEEVGDSVAGPVGIVGQLFPAFTAAGPRNLAFLAALISVSLACMNVLPIPALDGGRWLLIVIYKLCKKELSKETEERIVSRAMMVLLALIFIVTVLDVVRIASGG